MGSSRRRRFVLNGRKSMSKKRFVPLNGQRPDGTVVTGKFSFDVDKLVAMLGKMAEAGNQKVTAWAGAVVIALDAEEVELRIDA